MRAIFQKMWDAYKRLWAYSIDFKGTSTRSDFWYALLFHLLLANVFVVLSIILNNASTPDGILRIYNIYSLATFIPFLSLLIRRFRDAGFSFWWVVISFLIDFIIFYYLYHLENPSLPSGLAFLFLAYKIFILIVLMLPSKKSTHSEDG
ncbi:MULTISPECIES: DUF805 domain-containing protein [unclassified Helicobacter]|uniref:DUF805 domain-containing protein n=1 Tax=unclassified Helicobacter TaxID=2593540 RepID=UPI000CF0A081|nr:MULTISPECIES: DUF805 domain-containing protein [unclassified Helicobacter]